MRRLAVPIVLVLTLAVAITALVASLRKPPPPPAGASKTQVALLEQRVTQLEQREQTAKAANDALTKRLARICDEKAVASMSASLNGEQSAYVNTGQSYDNYFNDLSGVLFAVCSPPADQGAGQ